MTNARLPVMSTLEREVFDIFGEVSPVEMYGLGLDEFQGKIFVMSRENIDRMLAKIAAVKKECGKTDVVARKLLESIETTLIWDEPAAGISQVTNALSGYLIKEGFKPDHMAQMIDCSVVSLEGWMTALGEKNYPVGVRILAQYQVLGVLEVVDLVEKESKDPALTEKAQVLRRTVEKFKQKYAVAGFISGDFDEVKKILSDEGAALRREEFYHRALRYAFDYSESWKVLERKALKWLRDDLRPFKATTKKLAKKLGCPNDPEAVQKMLRERPGMHGKQTLETTNRIRPVIQKLVSESIAGINPGYNARVIETPPYLAPIIPTAAAQGFGGLTDKPSQIYFLTTDPKMSPPGGLADLVDTLVHEEYGHCLHFSNTAAQFEAKATIAELLPSLHTGTTSEGLSFQRELEFLDLMHRLAKKKPSQYTVAEAEFIRMLDEYGGFDQFLLEIDFGIYRFRLIRFLRVIGDTRINSGKQNLLDFLTWAEKTTKLAQRSIYYQLFPAHEGIFPGYATCYAVVGQDIRAIQRRIKNDPRKLTKFNAYATSMGYPPRSIYLKRLRAYAQKLSKTRR